ncbi:hypothetical protein ACJ73_03857 [Blastomyces percursus]|uniref:Uncharacterized protein n=1 Tax=Blastomyces percursus TaxID=1658174 RepID=A0A1J9R8G0_9EURO|nr:hypothetical protein ACJ73_03857 [Blastomyces percursus]
MSTVEEQTGVMSQSQAPALQYEDQHEIASEEENTEEGHEGDEPGLPPAPQTLDRSVRRDLDRVNIRGLRGLLFRSELICDVHSLASRATSKQETTRNSHATICASSTSSENLTSQNVSDVFSNDTSCQSESLYVVDNTDLDEESLVWAGSECRPGKNKIRTRNSALLQDVKMICAARLYSGYQISAAQWTPWPEEKQSELSDLIKSVWKSRREDLIKKSRNLHAMEEEQDTPTKHPRYSGWLGFE